MGTGDNEEFRAFVAEASPVLLRAAYLLLRDRSEAEDAVQSTLFRVLRRWGRAKAAPGAYSQTVLVNVCRDHWKQTRRHPTESIEASGREPVWARSRRTGDPAGPSLEVVEQRELLKEALERLPVIQREVLVMRFFLDLPVARTAELLGVAEGTVKSATSRGLEHLRTFLSPPHPPQRPHPSHPPHPTHQEATGNGKLAVER